MMPLPKPKAEEKQADWMDRCMGDPRFISEYPESEQRSAVCMRTFEADEREPDTNAKPALNFSKGERIRANIRCEVNQAQVRREQRDGRDVVVVPSFTLPDDIIMNGILYPAAEIEKSYKTLEGTPAPLGHPMVNSMFVSAKSPLGLNIGYFGAWNANVTRVEGRVYIEKVIDVERATESKMGRRVLAALDDHRPIHTSTGLLMNIRECPGSDLADWEGFDMEFDHDAILLDEDGAATPDQGVGMLVNDSRVQVVNSDLAEHAQEHIDMLGVELMAAFDRQEAVSRWAQLKEAIMEVIGLGRVGSEPEPKEAEEMDQEEKKQLLNRLSTLETAMETATATMNTVAETVKSIGEMAKAHNETIEQLNADRAAARAEIEKQAVEAELLTEEDAKATPLNALKALLNSAQKDETPTSAPGIYAGFNGAGADKISLAEDWEK